MYTHILFDMDDTILDFQQAQFESFKSLLQKYEIPFSEELYIFYKSINHSLWEQFDKGIMSKANVQRERFTRFFVALGKQIDGEQANAFYQECLSTQTGLIPHAKEVCLELSTHYTLSIVTNGVGATQKKRFMASEIFPYFSHIIVSEEIGIAKPDKAFFDKAFKIIGCTAFDRVLLVGDSISSDIQGANNADIDCCWFNPSKVRDTGGLKITYSITDLRQLADILRIT